MQRRRFIKNIAVAIVSIVITTSCVSQESQFIGKWEVVQDNSVSKNYLEFLPDGSMIDTTILDPSLSKLNSSEMYEFKVIDGDRIKFQSKKIEEVRIFPFRFDQGFLYIKGGGAKGDSEIKYKKIS